MWLYYSIKKSFAFLETSYGFREYMRQKHGAYYYAAWTNEVKKIMVLYNRQIDERTDNPVCIRIYDADCYGTAYDDVDEYKEEFALLTGRPRERIKYAAKWLKQSIEAGKIEL